MKRTSTFSLFLLLAGLFSSGILFAQTELLTGGNMESATGWTITALNTPAGSEPTATWNYTTDTPADGAGGCLYVSSAAENNQRQYSIYQEVTLSTSNIYSFDAAFKDISASLTDSWCEVYLGTEPVAGEDYGTDQIMLAHFSTWDACTHASVDGTFKMDGCHEGDFIPDTAGTYFLVLKIGTLANNAFDILLDEVSLLEIASKPYPAFGADVVTGFAPLTVNFIDNSKMATSWSWDFGDGTGTSTEQNPSYTYDAVGKYTVTLVATNAEGDSTLVKTNYITVNEESTLPEGELLYGGNMESPDFWNITTLNADVIPDVTWNYTGDAPAAGEGGNLRISATVQNNQSQYCIWQPVDMLADSAYVFDGAFKDLTGVVNFWCEVYIGTVPPIDGNDYGADSIKIGQFQTWSDCSGEFVDGTFQEDGCNGENPIVPYRPESDGSYYFVMKIGNIDWEGNTYSFDILLDEITLKETTPVIVPEANFFADIASGDAPLTVQFYNQSENATSYYWEFGDGGTSTSEEPSYTYNAPGTYTVSLVAIGESTSDTLEMTDLITVTGTSSLTNNISERAFKLYPNPTEDMISVELNHQNTARLSIYNLMGGLVAEQKNFVQSTTCNLGDLEKGIYIIQVETEGILEQQRIVVR